MFSIVLHQLDSVVCPLCNQKDFVQRAQAVIDNARRIGTETFIHAEDICHGNKKLNVSFVAQLFNTRHGLKLGEEEKEKQLLDISALEIDDVGDSREERVFRMWMNSLNIDNMQVDSIFHDSENGVPLLLVLDKIAPGLVVNKR